MATLTCQSKSISLRSIPSDLLRLPSVTGFALRPTATENGTNASIKAQLAIQGHLYVDDLLISVKDSTQAVQLIDELSDFLASGGFQMAKYASNSREV